MENARVIIIEDSEDMVESLHDYLEQQGHTVVSSAGTLEAAQDLIRSTEIGSINAFIIDGNLTPGEISGVEGTMLSMLIKSKFGSEVIRIGFSHALDGVKGADFNTEKSAKKVLDILNSI